MTTVIIVLVNKEIILNAHRNNKIFKDEKFCECLKIVLINFKNGG